MKSFGWKSAGRGSLRPALSRSFSAWIGGTDPLPTRYEDRVREGYLNNPVAQRAVRLVAEGVGSAPVSASEPAVLPLLSAKTAGQGLVETVAMQLLLHGNAYVQVLTGADGAPVELFALRPERVTVEADARGWPVAFLYKAGEAAMRIAAEDAAGRPAVIHIKAANPLDDHYGLGCLGAATGAIAIHNAATKWNKALLDNAARPSGAMVYEPGEPGAALSSEQFERLRTELDNSFSGAGNAGRPMLLEGGLRWQALSLSPADMDFVGLKAASAREIALAFGVPSMLLGLPGDAGYANYREANKALWRLAILPVAATVLGAIADGLKGWFPGLALSVDLDQVPALSEERERLWGQVSGADFLSVQEKRAMLGLAPFVAELEGEPPTMEYKFNPWHDPTNGQFTFANAGFRGGGGRSGGGGATGRWDDPDRARAPKRSGNSPVVPIPLPTAKPRAAKAPKSEAKRTVSSGGYRFESDSINRATRVSGTLRLQPEQGRSRRNQRDAGKPDRMSSDHGGHYVAREFGGPKIALNHFAQDAGVNRGEYRLLELSWKANLKLGRTVSVNIVPLYEGRSRRPTLLHVTFNVDGVRRKRTIRNSKGGQ
jgi:HK97 family phage portal protein